MTKHITLPLARKLIDQAIAEKGEQYTPPATCVYFVGEEPACIVGVALSKVGLTAEGVDSLGLLSAGDRGETTAPNTASVWMLAPHLKDLGFTFTLPALNYLEGAQKAQDSFGTTWGQARERAKTHRHEDF